MRKKLFVEKVHFKGLKSIEDLSVALKRDFNILIGKNGAGKSNFLDFLNNSLRSLNREIPAFKYAKINLEGEDGGTFAVEIERSLQKHGVDDIESDERMKYRFKLYDNDDLIFDNFNLETNHTRIKFKSREFYFAYNIRHLFHRLGYYPLQPLFIKYSIPTGLECIDVPGTLRFSIVDEDDMWEAPDSLGFVFDMFWKLERTFEDDFDSLRKVKKNTILDGLTVQDVIVDNLKRFSPIEDIRFNENISFYKDENHVLIENLKLEFRVSNQWVPWSQLSDGTKRIFYILTEVTSKTIGPILIEEPELGVHPHQFNLLMNFLKEESADKQIIISTHSPASLDHLDHDELDNLLIATYNNDDGTIIKRLSMQQKEKAVAYMNEVGFLSDYWMLSDLEE